MCRSINSRIALALACLAQGQAFLATPLRNGYRSTSAIVTFAKKKAASGQGFGKSSVESSTSAPTSSDVASSSTPAASETASSSAAFLQSVQGGSTEKPKTDGRSPEERAKFLLREKYGMKTLEEERLSEKQREQVEAQRKQFAEMKKKAEANEEFDLFMVIPGPIIQGIYTFLQVGIAVAGLVFIASGLGITLEAWSKTSGEALPDDVDAFIANVIEPNFTTMLLVLLGFSVSLGGLAAAQLGSKSATYREDN